MADAVVDMVSFDPETGLAAAVLDSDQQVIVDRVLEKLGTPWNLFRVDAKRLWDNTYRVNVYCAFETGGTVPSISISDSFFVRSNADGIESKPPITRKHF